MAVKRRIIWMSDEAWDELKRRGAAVGLNTSQYIASWMLNRANAAREGVPAVTFATIDEVHEHRRPTKADVEAAIAYGDDVAAEADRFGRARPAPKPQRKR